MPWKMGLSEPLEFNFIFSRRACPQSPQRLAPSALETCLLLFWSLAKALTVTFSCPRKATINRLKDLLRTNVSIKVSIQGNLRHLFQMFPHISRAPISSEKRCGLSAGVYSICNTGIQLSSCLKQMTLIYTRGGGVLEKVWVGVLRCGLGTPTPSETKKSSNLLKSSVQLYTLFQIGSEDFLQDTTSCVIYFRINQ